MKCFRILLLALFCLCSVSHVSAWDEAEAIAFWETQQKNYFGADHFKKLDDRKYFVKFKSFPYEGIINIVSIEAYLQPPDYATKKPRFEAVYFNLNIPELTLDQKKQYDASIHRWNEYFNSFYFDQNNKKWLDYIGYQQAYFSRWSEDEPSLTNTGKKCKVYCWLKKNWAVIVFLGSFVFLILRLTNKKVVVGGKKVSAHQHYTEVNKKHLENTEVILKQQKEAAELQRQTNETMRALIDALKQNKDQ